MYKSQLIAGKFETPLRQPFPVPLARPTVTMADINKGMSAADAEDTHSVKIGEVATADVDVAAAYAHHLTGENAYTRKEATRLRWKLDLRLVPLLWCKCSLTEYP